MGKQLKFIPIQIMISRDDEKLFWLHSTGFQERLEELFFCSLIFFFLPAKSHVAAKNYKVNFLQVWTDFDSFPNVF